MSTPMTDDEVERFIAREAVARIGCHAEGRTYVVPVAYAWNDGAICFFSQDGLKIEMMTKNPEVCVEIDRVEHLGSWRSVIARGHAEILAGSEAAAAAEHLAGRLTQIIEDPASRARLEEALGAGRSVHVLRIALVEKTGRVEGDIRQ